MTIEAVPGGDVRTKKGMRTRARFIEAGKIVFARDGFLKSRIVDIASEAGVSYGSFYHYFDSKEQIFREIAEEMEVRLLSMDDLSSGSQISDPYERIKAANRSYLTAYRANADIMRVIQEVETYDAEVHASRVRRQAEFADRLAASVHRLQRSGLADPEIDTQYAAIALGGMVAFFASAFFVAGGSYDFDEAVEQLSILWANAIGVRRH